MAFIGGTEVIVHNNTAGNQQLSSIADLAGGGYVVVWTDFNTNTGDGSGSSIKARIYNADGTERTSEFLVNTDTEGAQRFPNVIGTSNGGFVVAWNSTPTELTSDRIRVRAFSESGIAVTDEQAIGLTSGALSRPNLTQLNDQDIDGFTSRGNVVVSWSGPAEDGNGTSEAVASILQLELEASTFITSTFFLNSILADNQTNPSISALENGGFVAVWASQEAGVPEGTFGLYARTFDNEGIATSAQFQFDGENLSAPTGETGISPIARGLPGGGFVVTWNAAGGQGDGQGSAIRGAIFDGALTPTSNFQANSDSAGDQINPQLDVLTNGNFVITWTDRGSSGDFNGTGIRGQEFSADGLTVGEEFLVNESVTGDQFFSAITALPGGGFAVSYTDFHAPFPSATNNGDVVVRVFASPATDFTFSEDDVAPSFGLGPVTSIDVLANAEPGAQIDANVALVTRFTTNAARLGDFDLSDVFDSIYVEGNQIKFVATDAINFLALGESAEFEVEYALTDGSIQTARVVINGTDDAPSISFYHTGGYPIPENNTLAGDYRIEDVDSDVGAFSFAITGGADAALFALQLDPNVTDAQSGNLVFLTPPDFENPTDANGDNIYQISVRATDGTGTVIDFDNLQLPVRDVAEVGNSAPVASNASNSGNEDASISGAVSATDADEDALTYSIVTGPTHGTLTLNAGTGAYTYTPNANYNGADSFTFKANDGTADSNIATVSLSVAAVNDAPVVSTLFNGGAIPEDTSYTFTTAQLLSVVSDVDGDPLTISEVALAPVFGTVTDNGNGTWTVNPTPNYVGPVSITYRVSDGLRSVSLEAYVTTTSVNDAPVAANGSGSGDEDAVISGMAVATDVDLDNGPLSYSIVAGPAHGALILNAQTGAYTYTPNANYNGADSFTFKANDGTTDSNIATVSLSVEAVNDAPVVSNAPPAEATAEDTPFAFSLPANIFADVDLGDTLTYTTTLADGSPLPTWITETTSGRDFVGTPPADFNGTLSIRVTATDSAGETANALFAFDVTPVNDRPEANGTIANQTLDEDVPFNLVLPQGLYSDVDAGDTLTLSTSPLPAWLSFNASTGTFSGTPTNGDVGNTPITVFATDAAGTQAMSTFNITVNNVNDAPTVGAPFADIVIPEESGLPLVQFSSAFSDVDAGDTLTYSATLSSGDPLPSWLFVGPNGLALLGVAPQNYNGTLSVRVTATDLQGASVSDDFNITVTPVNDAPVAFESSTTVIEDGSVTVALNAIDPDSPNLTFAVVTDPANGTVTINANGTYTYTPNANFNGTDSFVFRANDGLLDSNSVTNTIVVNPVNDAPTQVADQGNVAITEGDAVSLNFAGNFADVDSDALTYSATGLPSWLTLNATTGALSGTSGSADSGVYNITVSASDGSFSASDSFTLTVNNENIAPIVSAPVTLDAIAEDSAAITITSAQLLANASDADGNTLSVTGLTASSGTLSNNGSGTWSFTPAANDDSSVTLSYSVSDGSLSVATSASLDLTPVNDAPTATNGSASGDEDTVITGSLAATDVDSTTLTYSIVNGPANGTLTLDAATGVYSYTPSSNFNGTDSFTFKANDGTVDGNVATVSLNVASVNDAPVLTAAILDTSTEEDAAFNFVLPSNTFTDVDNAALTLTTSALPGWLSFNAATRTFSGTPTNANVGVFNVTVTASDGALSVSDVFAITVTNTNDAPTVAVAIVDQAATQGAAFSYVVPAGTFADVDAGDTLTLSTLGLPAWLTFDAATRTFAGTPGTGDVGTVNVTVVATDSAGVATSDVFAITVANSGPPPITGTNGNNNINGTNGSDTINALGGNDNVNGRRGDDVIDGGAGNDDLDGGSGDDTLLGGTGNDDLYGRSGMDLLFGGDGNDDLFGGEDNDQLFGGAGNDELNGGSGADIINGGLGADRLEGDGGADRFVFTSTADSGLGAANRDRILDFRRGSDLIDLAGIDANTSVAGDQAFSYIGNSAFHGVAGELRFAGGILSGDINGNGVADFEIQVQFTGGQPVLTAIDFIL